jgi:hypothetical protein
MFSESTCSGHIMLKYLLTQKGAQKKVTDFGSRSSANQPICYFYVFQVVEQIRTVLEQFHYSKNSIFGQFLPILATIYEVKITFLKKLVGGAPVTYFKWDIQHWGLGSLF